MAGRGVPPKPDSVRRRRNVATSAAVLPSQAEMRRRFRGRRGTKLPKHLVLPPRPDGEPWQQRTLDWWQETVTSPMATQYLDADLHGLYMAFALIDEFYVELASSRRARGHIGRLTMLAVEVRQQVARFGITPRDRLSLHWGVADDEVEQPKGGGDGGAPTPRVTDIRSRLGQESA